MDRLNHILVVEEDDGLRDLIGLALTEAGHQVSLAATGNQALELLAKHVFQTIITDLRVPGPSGLDMLNYVREHATRTPVIVMTAYASVDDAVKAMREGAFDFQTKPLNLDHLLLTVERALERATLSHAFDYLRNEQPYLYQLKAIVAESAAMKEVLRKVARVAPTNFTVMLTGESGTGKSLIAGSIHANSPRRDHTLVTVNCAALSETLLESELFGHEKGAFTGAHKDRTGRVQQAHGGTLFLDEVGDMSPATQAKILRAIEDRVIRRVGGNREIRVDVRIISATNHELTESVKRGAFREDLFYRLNVTPIRLPSLRERPEDIVPLATRFIDRVCRELKRPPMELSPATCRAMEGYQWPGNIRELRNAIERAVLFATDRVITPDQLNLATPQAGSAEGWPSDDLNLERLERRAIETALERSDYVQARAAALLGISPRALVYKLDKLQIRHPELDRRRRRAAGP